MRVCVDEELQQMFVDPQQLRRIEGTPPQQSASLVSQRNASEVTDLLFYLIKTEGPSYSYGQNRQADHLKSTLSSLPKISLIRRRTGDVG
jgi:hypothetical protein